MTAEEAVATRERAGLSVDALAAELGVTPEAVRAWEQGRVGIPRRHEQQLVWQAAVAERQAAVAASGLAECGRAAELVDGLERAARLEDVVTAQEALGAHVGACETCQARERFVAERFGPLPDLPRPGWVRAIAWVERVPEWARPALLGAVALGGIVSVRVLLALPAVFSDPRRLGAAVVAVLAAACAGAAGGLAYSLTRPTLRRLGTPGDYLTGVVCAVAYMGSLALAAPLAFGKPMVEKSSDLAALAITAIFFGLVIGHSWFRQSPTVKAASQPGPAA